MIKLISYIKKYVLLKRQIFDIMDQIYLANIVLYCKIISFEYGHLFSYFYIDLLKCKHDVDGKNV